MQPDKSFYKPFIKEKYMKKALIFLLVLLTVLPCAIACKTGGDSENTKGTRDMSFSIRKRIPMTRSIRRFTSAI